MASPSKVILVFCDGTGQDGIIACDIMGNRDTTTRSATNVLRLSRAVLPFKGSGGAVTPQIVYYQTGVGTESDFNTTELLSASVIQAFGRVVASKIRDVYVFIAQNYMPGDEICLFGYSRGAYTVRKVAGLIERIGLLPRNELGQFAKIWSELNDGKYNRPPPSTPIKVKCVGVWDTVGSVRTREGKVIDALSIQDCSLPGCIEYAFHAVAFHENRAPFPPTLWNSKPKHGQVLKQVWFAGCHADVGGGQVSRELADLSLFWMAGEIESFVKLDLSILWASHQKPNAAWGASQPYNNFHNDVVMRALGSSTRQGEFSKGIDTKLHESMVNSPSKLENPRDMITLASIPGQRPPYAKLNKLEEDLKNKWDASPSPGNTSFESPIVISTIFVNLATQVLGAAMEAAGNVVRGVGGVANKILGRSG